jgi:hypothetical protein
MLTIIVPYRDREDHLSLFIPHMNKYLPEANIIIVEQAGSDPFNRGRLLNIGVLESSPSSFYIFHDVDILPLQVDYTTSVGVTQLASSDIQKVDYLGGVTMFDNYMFFAAGGYHNDYFHRAEDNEMMFRLKSLKIGVRNRFGIFRQLPHERSGPEFIPELWQKSQLPRSKDMLKTCSYDLIYKRVYATHTHISALLLQ